jgi:hypothetical protein
VETFKFVGANFCGLLDFLCGFLYEGCYFVDICKRDNSGMSIFIEDVNSRVRDTHKFYEIMSHDEF